MSDALVNQWNWLIFSPKLRQVLDTLINDNVIQYIDVVMTQGPKGKQLSGFKLCNSLSSIEAIDMEQSVLVFHDDSDDILGIDSLVLDKGKIGECPFFRLKEYAPALIVREDLVEAVQKSGCTGMRFLPVDKYKR